MSGFAGLVPTRQSSALEQFGAQVASGNRSGARATALEIMVETLAEIPVIGPALRVILKQALESPANRILENQFSRIERGMEFNAAFLPFQQEIESLLQQDVLASMIRASNAHTDEILRALRVMAYQLHVELMGAKQGRVSSAESERQRAERLLTRLENYGVLYQDSAKRCPGGVIDRVGELRALLQDLLLECPREWWLAEIGREMIKASSKFLDLICLSCQNDLTCRNCKIPEKNCMNGLGEFRRYMGREIHKLCTIFSLEPDRERVPPMS